MVAGIGCISRDPNVVGGCSAELTVRYFAEFGLALILEVQTSGEMCMLRAEKIPLAVRLRNESWPSQRDLRV